MADVDSLHDLSDTETDPNGLEVDADDEEAAEESVDPSLRKKSKKKKRKTRDVERSSGDSDGQGQDGPELKHLEVQDNVCVSHSGMEADSESQGSHDSKTDAASTNNVGADATAAIKNISDNQKLANLTQIQSALELLTMPQGAAPKSIDEAKKKKYQFWETQPVPKFDEDITVNEEIELDKPPSEIRQEPLSLPHLFMWDTLDISEPLILKELYTLLNENYVEDDDNMFRFDYSPEFLQCYCRVQHLTSLLTMEPHTESMGPHPAHTMPLQYVMFWGYSVGKCLSVMFNVYSDSFFCCFNVCWKNQWF
ncbi:glycylpeptide N-tetradecanoyltransferase [Elysia marginata]|uniref:glycylpeptide N-tetradecanoyltransferase n=1 Tax=Elysia marginata TaxID=1093978 RepID=A0AAV4J1A0_9GAST|nr:glycylpeptide N-tetradecanoyltransferase [Elysia marginata]